MLDWASLKQEHQQMVERLANPELPHQERAVLQKKTSAYADVLALHEEIVSLEHQLDENKKQLEKETGDMRELFLEEVAQNESTLRRLTKELEEFLYPPDERDSRSVFLEIRGGAGGQEASLFAADLFRMYNVYALNKHWHLSIVEETSTGVGGFSKITAHITGKNVYKFLKFESGVHRVQRVPKTESAGRVHTSTVTVAVLPEADDVDISINTNDLRIDTYRSSGAGGQHVNTTDSAIRITHIPSGLVVTCQDERSQTKNKAKAMKVLQARLLELEEQKRAEAIRSERKQQVGSGDRSEKIRTYNFPQNRVTDHRTEVTLKKLDRVMEGDLDDLINPLQEWDLAERRTRGSFLEK